MVQPDLISVFVLVSLDQDISGHLVTEEMFQ